MDPLISLITLARDNPEELAKTVRSVALQTVKPDTYVVLDSSSHALAPRMKDIAESAGATYVWTAPEGIYPAMRKSIDLIPSDSYSWWINSSDWLAGSGSIQIARESLARAKSRPSWLVGQLIRLRDGRYGYHRSGIDGGSFVRRMQTGRTGFPHPSTIFWTPDLKQVTPYADSLRIASDYSTALRFAGRFGPPIMEQSPLAVHVPDGLSVQMPARNLIEKSKARLSHNSGQLRLVEPAIVSANALRGVIGYFSAHPGGLKRPPQGEGILGKNSHFCVSGNDWFWPECCDTTLDAPNGR